MTPIPDPGQGPTLVQRVDTGGHVYELRRVDCGKPNCSFCNLPGGRRASHGPYWYHVARRGHKWLRLYIGKTLNTGKFLTPDGKIDWNKVSRRPGHDAPQERPSNDPPGQMDLLTDARPPEQVRRCFHCGFTQTGPAIDPARWAAANLCEDCSTAMKAQVLKDTPRSP